MMKPNMEIDQISSIEKKTTMKEMCNFTIDN